MDRPAFSFTPYDLYIEHTFRFMLHLKKTLDFRLQIALPGRDRHVPSQLAIDKALTVSQKERKTVA